MPKSAAMDWRVAMDDLKSSNKECQNRALLSPSEMTKEPVDQAKEAWDKLLRMIVEGDNRQRAISGQLLCSLAKSDPEQRIVNDMTVLLALTKDERFVTARHCLLSLWKIAIVGPRQRKTAVDGFVCRFKECAAEKNCTLIRYDIHCALRRVFDFVPDEQLRSKALRLIELESDPKYRKKYATVWRAAKAPGSC